MVAATYLLGSQALVDSARNERTAIHDWAGREDIADTEVCVSVISFTLFRSALDASDADERAAWTRAFDITLARVRGYGGLRAVTVEIALRAGELRAMTLPTGDDAALGDLGRLVAATALEERLVLVERRAPWHERLERLHGLALLDPYTGW